MIRHSEMPNVALEYIAMYTMIQYDATQYNAIHQYRHLQPGCRLPKRFNQRDSQTANRRFNRSPWKMKRR